MTPRKATKPTKKAAPRRKPGRPSLLTDDRAALIVNAIRAGSFDHVASQAAGVGPSTFRAWMAQADHPDPAKPPSDELLAFAAEVRTARAGARVRAENRVFMENPLAWLRLGPGRDRGDPDEPGWTDQVAVTGGEGGPVEVIVTYENDWRGQADE